VSKHQLKQRKESQRNIKVEYRTIPLTNKYNKIVPQLVPFYFLNQLSYGLFLLMVLLYLVSKYILPLFVQLQLTRMQVSK
jgi:F-type H+-transporting ATPase subunit 8